MKAKGDYCEVEGEGKKGNVGGGDKEKIER
jgi:hypothetical protein